MAEPEIVERQETSLARINPQALMEKALEASAPIETLERLVALAERVREIQAREAWYAAMARFHAECPPIYKSKTARIRTRTGPGYEYTFASLDNIKPTVDPILGKHGLSARWTSPVIEKDRVTVECMVSHELGHSESSGAVTMPILSGQEDVGANPMQRVAIAMTYAKRYALLNVLGLAPEEDEDGHTDGGTEQAQQAGQGGQAQASGPDDEAPITEGQVRKFYAIARGAKPVAWSDEQIALLINGHSYEHVRDIKTKDYDAMLQKLKAGPGALSSAAKPAQGQPPQQGNLA